VLLLLKFVPQHKMSEDLLHYAQELLSNRKGFQYEWYVEIRLEFAVRMYI